MKVRLSTYAMISTMMVATLACSPVSAALTADEEAGQGPLSQMQEQQAQDYANQQLKAQQSNPLNSELFKDVTSTYAGGSKNATQQRDLRLAIFAIVRYALGLVGTIVLVLALYSGYLWFTAEGNMDQVETAKKTIRNLVVGWFVIAISYALISFVFRSVFAPQKEYAPSLQGTTGEILNNQLNPVSGFTNNLLNGSYSQTGGGSSANLNPASQ